jgi:hypothetical protein
VSDIVDRLRADARRVENPHLYETQSLELYAADEIERLRREAETDNHNLTHLGEANAILRTRLAEAEALLRDIRRGDALWLELNERIDAFLASDSSRE